MPKLSDFVQPTTTLTANDTIQIGDVVALASDGFAYMVNDPTADYSTTANTRPAFQSPTAGVTRVGTLSVSTAVPAPLSSTALLTVQSATLTSGNVVIAWLESSARTPWFSIYGPTGAQVVAPTQISSTTGSSSVGIGLAALTGGGFAVVWGTSGGWNKAIYSNTGSVVSAAAIFDSTNSPFWGTPCVVALTGGGWAVAYVGNVGGIGEMFYAVFTASGSVTKAPTNTVADPMNTPPTYKCAAALSGGGFVVLTYSPSVPSVILQIFNAAGTQQGTNITAASSIASSWACGLSGGGFVVVHGVGGTIANVYNSSGVLQGSAQTLDASGPGGNQMGQSVDIAPMSGGGATIAWQASGFVRTGQVSASGALTGSIVTLATASTAGIPIIASLTADGGVVVHYSGAMAKLNASNVLVGPAAPYPTTETTNDQFAVTPFASTPYIAAINKSGVMTVWYGNTILARVPVGVAQSSASATQTFTAQISGPAGIRLSFNQTWSVNYQRLTPPGQAMAVVGNEAVMAGLLPSFASPPPRPIN